MAFLYLLGENIFMLIWVEHEKKLYKVGTRLLFCIPIWKYINSKGKELVSKKSILSPFRVDPFWESSKTDLNWVVVHENASIVCTWTSAWQNKQNDICAQRRLRSAWASAHWIPKDPSFLYADSEDSDQTGRMPRLLWVFAGRTCNFVLSRAGSNRIEDTQEILQSRSITVPRHQGKESWRCHNRQVTVICSWMLIHSPTSSIISWSICIENLHWIGASETLLISKC